MITKDDKEENLMNNEYQKNNSDEVIKSNTRKNIGLFLKGWFIDAIKRFCITFWPVLVLFVVLFIMANFSSHDLDEISDYNITVEPNVEDGSLDITYDIIWKVLDSTSQGPLTWVKIGTPNEYFTPTALSDNIKSISNYDNTYVRIDFANSYYKDDVVHFKYKIHDKNVCYFEDGKFIYDFTPAWFTDAKVDHIQINWLSEGVKKYSPEKEFFDVGEYLILEDYNLKKGKKVNFQIEYAEDYFHDAIKFSKSSNKMNQREDSFSTWWIVLPLLPYLGIFLLYDFIASFCYDYRRNRGFRMGTFRHYSRPINRGGGGFRRRRWRRMCMCVCLCMCWKWQSWL